MTGIITICRTRGAEFIPNNDTVRTGTRQGYPDCTAVSAAGSDDHGHAAKGAGGCCDPVTAASA
jgi:hypothetical protein